MEKLKREEEKNDKIKSLSHFKMKSEPFNVFSKYKIYKRRRKFSQEWASLIFS